MKKFKIFFLVFSFAGVLFSGYMSGVKLFTKTCAFGETCPIFLGMPACYFGFTMFFLLALFSVLLSLNKWKVISLAKSMFVVSLLGVLFAGYFSIGELPLLFKNGFSYYLLGLPTCILGCIFFVIIFFASIIFNYKLKINKLQ